MVTTVTFWGIRAVRRLLVVLAVAFAGSVVAGGVGVSMALAGCTNPAEQTIFAANESELRWGSQNTIPIVNRDLATDCSYVEAHSTSQLGSDVPGQARQVEVGWTEDLPSGSKRWRLFWEWQNFGAGNTGHVSFSCCPSNMDFRVGYNATLNSFKYHYQDNGGGWVQIGPANGTPAGNVNFPVSTGWWPKGETGRYGGDGTGASDDHSGLLFSKDATSGTWINWTGSATQQDNIDNWHRCWLSATHYDVRKTGDACP